MKVTDKPTLQEFHIEGVKHITPENAYEEIAENRAVLIIGESAETKRGKIKIIITEVMSISLGNILPLASG